MIFTSYTYVFFLAAAFLIHWSLPRAARKPFLILASYVFYASWDWRFCFLLLGLSVFNWAYAKYAIAQRQAALWPGIIVNVAALVVFKYTAFLYVNVASAGRALGAGWPKTLPFDIILPLGISFFTFQGIAYLIDVATGEEPFEFVDFLLYKSLWPQLIAGPIIRPGEIRPDIDRERRIDYADCAEGMQRILFGFFKKIILADQLAPVVDAVFVSKLPNALDAGVALVAFGMQIYFDFSAYSDIAIGSARLFGFHYPENFQWPYAASSPQEFWNRWHMTLSRWIRDYVFTPLAFATRNRPRMANVWLLVAMATVGLWHGAQWTFVLWGVWHGVLLIANQTVFKRFFEKARSSRMVALIATAFTFALVTLGWLLFRAESLAQVADFLTAIFTVRGGFHLRPSILRVNDILITFVYFIGMLTAQSVHAWLAAWHARGGGVQRLLWTLRPVGYATLILLVIFLDQEAQKFVYFQF